MTQLTFGQIEDLWISNGGNAAWAPLMAGIAMAESGGNTTAWNNNSGTGDDSVGLWQINYYGSLYPSRQAAYGAPNVLVNSPDAQAKAAISLSNNGASLGPWKSDKAWSQWVKAGSPATPNSTTVQSWLSAAGVSTGGSAIPSVGANGQGVIQNPGVGGTTIPGVLNQPSSAFGGGGTNVSTNATSGLTTNPSIAGDNVPATAPENPGVGDNLIASLSSQVQWLGEYAGWALFTMIVFAFGAVLLLLGAAILVSILAGPAVGPVTAAVGKVTPSGKAFGLAKSFGGRKAAPAAATRRTSIKPAVGAGSVARQGTGRTLKGASATAGRGTGRTTSRARTPAQAEREGENLRKRVSKDQAPAKQPLPRVSARKPKADTTVGGRYASF